MSANQNIEQLLQFQISSCDCPIGRSGATCEEDFNPCVVEPCFPNVLCNDTLAPSLGFTCDTCPTGLMGDGFICQGWLAFAKSI